MKMDFKNTIFLFILIFVLPLSSQQFSLSSGNYSFDPRIAFENSGGIALRDQVEIVFSSQLYHLGLAGDHLNNQLLSIIYPVSGWGTVGIRGRQFTSDMMTDGTYSFMFARSFCRDKIALGMHINVHSIHYRKDQFRLRDPNDPLLSGGLSKNAMGIGISTIAEPIHHLRIGIQLDDINMPDISLEGGQAILPVSISAGISYGSGRFIPELKMNHYHYKSRNESYCSFGLNMLFLSNAARLSTHYQSDFMTFGAGVHYKNLNMDYEFYYPLNDLNTITTGSHVLTVSYRFSKKPEAEVFSQIQMISPQSIETDENYAQIQAIVQDESGLEPIKIKIEKPPVIELLAPAGNETNSSMIRMKVNVEFILEINDLKVKVNGEEIQFRGSAPVHMNGDTMHTEIDLNLQEGYNDIEVIAFNTRGATSEKRKILYNPITGPLYDKLWAVIIGIDQYQDRNVPDLSYAGRDAKAVESLLKDKFHFDQVITLYNAEATRDNIVRAVSASLKDVGENDGVFVFFAGHGCTGQGLEGGPLGYIVPSDGTLEPSEFYVKNVPMSQMKEIAQTIRAKHMFYAMDCCYGGLLLRGGENKKKPSDKANYAFLQNLAGKKVRQVLTAGGQDQPVLDSGQEGHSVFTGKLIQGLNGDSDFNQDGYITAEEINFYIRQHVSIDAANIARSGNPLVQNIEQIPQYGKWFGEGEFIFGK